MLIFFIITKQNIEILTQTMNDLELPKHPYALYIINYFFNYIYIYIHKYTFISTVISNVSPPYLPI